VEPDIINSEDEDKNEIENEKIKELNINLKPNKKNKFDSMEKILKKMGKVSSNLNLEKFNDDSLNLSCLLNILDGIIELHGVMVIFTSNHPEKLDEAFMRPGRIDFKQEFKRATIETAKLILTSKFDKDFVSDKFKFSDHVLSDHVLSDHVLYDHVLSPAEIQSICFKNDSFDECIEELKIETNKHIDRIKKNNIKSKFNHFCFNFSTI